MRYIFDSSFILSLIMINDVNHAIALEKFDSLSSDAIFHIGELTYIELLTVTTYKLWVREAKKLQQMIADMGVIFLGSGTTEYVNFFNFMSKKISIIDASIIYDSMRYHLEILSFDKELLKIARQQI